MAVALKWEGRRQSLKYNLSDYCLCQFPFEAMVVDAPLTCYFADSKLLQDLIATVGEVALPYVIRRHPAPRSLTKFAIIGKHLRYVPGHFLNYYIDFDGSFSEYLKKFSAKSRYNLARSARKLAELDGGEMDWHEYRGPEDMADFHRLASELSRQTYTSKVLRDDFANRAGSCAHLHALAERDAVRGYILFNRGQPIAYVFCRCYQDTLSYDVIGYDRHFHKYSPGNMLLYVLIEKMFAERAFKYLDFGEGGKFWSNGVTRGAYAYFFPMAVPIIFAVIMHAVCNALTDLLGEILTMLGLRDKMRRLLRERLLSGGNG